MAKTMSAERNRFLYAITLVFKTVPKRPGSQMSKINSVNGNVPRVWEPQWIL